MCTIVFIIAYSISKDNMRQNEYEILLIMYDISILFCTYNIRLCFDANLPWSTKIGL